MSNQVLDTFARFFALWWLLAVAIAIALAVMWPLMALSATRNIRGIRRELARLNDNLERLPARTAAPGQDLPDVPLYTRTGPLNIR